MVLGPSGAGLLSDPSEWDPLAFLSFLGTALPIAVGMIEAIVHLYRELGTTLSTRIERELLHACSLNKVRKPHCPMITDRNRQWGW